MWVVLCWYVAIACCVFFFQSRRRHTRLQGDWSSDVCSSDLYNVDYPLYYFYLQNKSYDYYLMCEHDAVLNIDIDEFVRIAERDRVDYVGFPLAQSSWTLRTCDGVYPKSFTLYNWLNCISLHSRRSVEFLLER